MGVEPTTAATISLDRSASYPNGNYRHKTVTIQFPSGPLC